MESIAQLLQKSAELHRHLCPRQVLGVRMAMRAEELLRVELPQSRKRILAIVETDGCFSDGVAVAANCWVGRRTMRVEDFGKTAVTFVDTEARDGQRDHAWRISPHADARHNAPRFAPEARNRWEAMLLGYQRMPHEELLVCQLVALNAPVAEIISRAGYRVDCESCGEEIVNEREVVVGGRILCRACAGDAYYRLATQPARAPK